MPSTYEKKTEMLSYPQLMSQVPDPDDDNHLLRADAIMPSVEVFNLY